MTTTTSPRDPAHRAARAPNDEDRDLASWLARQEDKELLRFVTIGSVDDGKSTLIGRLLHDAHGVYEDQLHAVRRASTKGATRGSESASEIDFSLFTDGLAAEREQGITIDVAYRYFATARRKFIIADTPGHVQYTRNMATGASTADVAIILVDARRGVLAQTRRHARIAALLGIRHVVACVNKMDLVGFDPDVFERIRVELEALGRELGIPSLVPIPVSALRGDNVVTRSSSTPFWRGAPLLEHLETLALPERGGADALRLPVQLVLRPHQGYRGFAGKIASGSVRPGDEILVLPSGRRTRVRAVDVHGHEVKEAFAPMNVTLRLDDEVDVSRGDAIVAPSAPPEVASSVEANLVWMSERPLDRSRTYLLKHTTRVVRATVAAIDHVVDLDTHERRATTSLALNDIAQVTVRCHAPIFFDPYAKNRVTGAFILVDTVTNDTVAAGMIVRGVEGPSRGRATERRDPVSDDERRERLGQRGVVVDVRAPSYERAVALARAIERRLFDRGRLTAVVEPPADASGGSDPSPARFAAEVCARAGLVALLPRIAKWYDVAVDGIGAGPVVAPIAEGTATDAHPSFEGVERDIGAATEALLERLGVFRDG